MTGKCWFGYSKNAVPGDARAWVQYKWCYYWKTNQYLEQPWCYQLSVLTEFGWRRMTEKDEHDLVPDGLFMNKRQRSHCDKDPIRDAIEANAGTLVSYEAGEECVTLINPAVCVQAPLEKK